MPNQSDADEPKTTETKDKPVAPSTMASRRRERLEREAREGVPPRRRFGLRAGENPETDLVIVYIGREDREGQRFTMADPHPRPPRR
jgi:hypothetical protein